MKKHKILALALAAALACPQVAFAAEDASGMQYVSASEGLFGSLRTIYTTGKVKANRGRIQADGSVFGYRGSLDLGGGLTGTYHYEQQILGQQDERQDMNGKIRYNFVGLKGAFGSMEAGSFGSFVAGVPNVTDVTANGGGAFVPFYRVARAIQYTSPELNGFQAGGHIRMSGGAEGTSGTDMVAAGRAAGCYAATNTGNTPDSQVTVVDGVRTCATAGHTYRPAVAAVPATGATAGNPNADQWALAGVYNVRGFRVGATYIVDVDEWNTPPAPATGADSRIKTEDMTTWFLSGKYSQDNWSVAVMHGQKNTSDNPNKTSDVDGTKKWQEDQTYTSFGGNITVGKVGLAVLHDISDNLDGEKGKDRSVTAFSAIYNFTARSRVWVAYVANSDDNATADGDDRSQDEVIVGMRMDF